jgi:hypothetical protein
MSDEMDVSNFGCGMIVLAICVIAICIAAYNIVLVIYK